MTSSLAKGLRIVDFLADAPESMTVRTIARGIDLPKSTVHRLLIELQLSGVIEAVPDGYRLGLRLFELGGSALRQIHLVEVARPHMELLFGETRRVTQLGVLQGTDVVYLARVGQQGHQRVVSPVAGRVPASCSALGKALLAHNPIALDAAVTEGLQSQTRHSIRDASILQAQLDQVRRTGIAAEYEEGRIGLSCVASPFVVEREYRAALSLTGPAATFDPLSAASAIKKAASKMSSLLATV